MSEQQLAREIVQALQPNRDWTPDQRRVIAAIMLIQQCPFAEAASALWSEIQDAGHNAWHAPHILGCWATSAGYRVQSARFDQRKRLRLIQGGAQ